MFTVCSKCNLRLTVTATDLRAAQGYVRCGRCHNVFNALAALADDPARQAEAEGTASATQSRPALTPPEPPSPEPAAAEASAMDSASTDTSLEFNPASTNINEVFIEAVAGEGTGTFESIILSVDEPPAIVGATDADPGIAPQALSAPGSPLPATRGVAVDVQGMRDALAEPGLTRPTPPEHANEAMAVADDVADPHYDVDLVIDQDEVPNAPPVPLQVPVPLPAPVPAPAVSRAAQHAGAEDPEDEIPLMSTWSAVTTRAEDSLAGSSTVNEIAGALHAADPIAIPAQPDAAAHDAELLHPERATSRVRRWALRGAAATLVLCLIGQVLHHYRGDLADTALLRRPLTGLYQRLGMPLEPRWNIASYEIRQLGANTDGAAPHDLVVRASISNRAARVQPLPLLRVVMQDQFSNRVAARDLLPAEYLARGAPTASLMAPGQRVDVQVAFQDPGQLATGFEIDACMRGHNGTVTCANDPGSH